MTPTPTPAQHVHEKLQMACWWSGIGYASLFFVGFMLLMGFWPPHSPQLSPAEVVALYSENILALKFGITLCFIAVTLSMPFNILFVVQIARMEVGRRFPILAVISATAAGVNTFLFYFPFLFWTGITYRMDTYSAELIRFLDDMVWINFVMPTQPFQMQLLPLVIAGFTSLSIKPVLPRWYIFFNLWLIVLYIPCWISHIFYDGPFAWNGLLTIWIAMVLFGIWFVLSFPVLYKAIKNHKYDVKEPVAVS